MELQTMAPGDEHDTNLDLLTLLINLERRVDVEGVPDSLAIDFIISYSSFI
jgi:hypothetical protein